jgi:HEAT repeat protein
MLRPLRFLFLVVWLAPSATRADGVEPTAADTAVLRAARLPVDGAGLIAFLQARAMGAAANTNIAALAARLGAPGLDERKQAAVELLGIGPAAVPALRTLASDPDAAGATAARRCLRTLENDSSALTGAVLRLTAARRPAGAAAALLAFLPHAEDEGIVEEAMAALVAVATREGKTDPVLLQALEDPVGLRRAAAVDVICRAAPENLPAVGKLLVDPVPAVRLRAALALARAHDPGAVTTLISLLSELPTPQALQAEEYLLALAEEQAPKIRVSDDGDSRGRCRDAWAAWWQSTEDPSHLFDEVRKRTRADADRDKVQALIRGLGDDAFEVRQKSSDGLKALGTAVAPMLRQASNHPDLEVRQRTQALLQEIEKETAVPLSLAVPRILALRKPAGTAEILLAYLPFADDDVVLAEVQEALDAVAFRDGKADPAIVKALSDKTASRRAAAAAALCQGSGADQRDAVRKLLDDPEPAVRVKVALALALARDRAAIPVLIALTGEAAGDVASAAEDYLVRLAGDRRPPAVVAVSGTDAAARGARREAWDAWWQAQGERVQLTGRPVPPLPTQRYSGYTLCVQTQSGAVCELDAAGKTRWQITGLNGPQDAQVLPGDHVLVTESNSRRVTERNLKGDILWQKETGNFPLSARRLPDGHTFIVTRNRISEVDRSGREVLGIDRPGNDVMTAQRMRDGKVAIVSSQSTLVLLDSTGRELKSVRLQGVSSFANDLLPKGGALVPLSWQNKVMEYDAEGKVVWEAAVQQPLSACRLPNGHTLVSSQQWPAKIIELDRDGKQVAELTTPTYVQRATRR